MTFTLPDVPGLRAMPTEVRQRLVDMADAHAAQGWNADGMAAQIAHESGWKTAIKNPASTATGFLQWTTGTAKALGTTTAAIARMTPLEQLDLAERYWMLASNGRTVGPRDWMILGLGTGNVGGYSSSLPDSAILYPAGSDGARANAALQDSAGNVTVATARAVIDRMLSGRGRLAVIAEADDVAASPLVHGAVALEGFLWLGLGLGLVWKLLRGRRA